MIFSLSPKGPVRWVERTEPVALVAVIAAYPKNPANITRGRIISFSTWKSPKGILRPAHINRHMEAKKAK